MNCPNCSTPNAYIGFASVECPNVACPHYKPQVPSFTAVVPGARVVCTSESKRRVPQSTHKEICRWTMKDSPEGEKCRYVGWTDEYGNRNVALEDTLFQGPGRKWWVIQPPAGQMEFNGCPPVKPKEGDLTPALNRWPGSDKIEDHFVVPETVTAKEIPATFEAMWSIAKPIENCPENTHLMGHYEKYKGA